MLISGYCNFFDVLVMVDQESDVAPITLFRPALKIFEDEQRADFARALNRLQCRSLDLTNFSLAELAADLDADDRAGRVDDCEWHVGRYQSA